LQEPWVDDAKREAAAQFLSYLRSGPQQDTFRRYAFRGYDGKPGSLTTQANGLLPDQPTKVLSPPAPDVLDAVLRSWQHLRKPARVILLVDVSGSMNQSSKLDLAKEGAIRALGEFAPEDDVGLWEFSGTACRELVPIAPISEDRSLLQERIASMNAEGATPLYQCVREAVDRLRTPDTSRITGVVVLSDGQNDVVEGGQDCLDSSTDGCPDGLVQFLNSELNVRVFPIGYGKDADVEALQKIASASRAAYYSASDPASIDKVFVSVISNF
jgi:Ca-activated chloride channel family protein